MVTGINTGYQDLYNPYNPYGTAPKPYLVEQTGIFNPQDGTKTTNKKNKKAGKIDANDGKISFGKKIGNLLKGGVKFFTGMFTDENGKFSLGQTLKTVAIGAAIAAATILIPGAGAVISLGFLASGAVHVGKGIYHAATAETDAEAEEAWQNIGSGAVETSLAFVGAKKTGAFGKTRKAGKSVINDIKDIKTAAKNEGVEGFKTEVVNKAKKAKTNIETTYKKTRTNWENLTDKEARFQNADKAYAERINKTKNTKTADRLRQEKQAYKDGYEAVKTETDYTKAAETLNTLKEDMAAARKKAMNPRATEAERAAYREANAKYQAAKTTLETRVNAGEFKNTLPDAQDRVDIAKAIFEEKVKSPKMTKEYNAEVQEAYQTYKKAIAERNANTGKTGIFFRPKAAVIDGIKYPDAQFLTIVAAGRGYNQVA